MARLTESTIDWIREASVSWSLAAVTVTASVDFAVTVKFTPGSTSANVLDDDVRVMGVSPVSVIAGVGARRSAR